MANKDVNISPMNEAHRTQVLALARQLVTSADTYAFDANVTDDELWQYWNPTKGNGYVAEHAGHVVGIFVLKPNHPGPGSHIANASYAVDQNARGLGVGRQMGSASLPIARELGYRAMQFNIVLAGNVAAVRLWESLGFRIMTTIPEGFRKPDGGFDDFHIMHRRL